MVTDSPTVIMCSTLYWKASRISRKIDKIDPSCKSETRKDTGSDLGITDKDGKHATQLKLVQRAFQHGVGRLSELSRHPLDAD